MPAALPSPRGNPTPINIGPGALYAAPLGTAEPTSVTGALPSGWVYLGYTEDGTTITVGITTADVPVAEEVDPVKIVTTARQVTIAAQLAEIVWPNLVLAYNGGVVAGTGSDSTFEMPGAGAETHVMLFHVNEVLTVGHLIRNALQTGNAQFQSRRLPNKTVIPVEFRAQIVAGAASPMKVYGTASIAVAA